MNSRSPSSAKQRGQAMFEYAIIAAALVGALFVPLSQLGGKTGAEYLAEMIRVFFRSLTFFISLP